MVQAVIAIEDRDFFEHGGINYLRIVKCGVQDLTLADAHELRRLHAHPAARARLLPLAGKDASRASSIEIMITFQLESRFNKQQIFEMYANQINLGHRGSYDINGFGEAAQTFFGKDLDAARHR